MGSPSITSSSFLTRVVVSMFSSTKLVAPNSSAVAHIATFGWHLRLPLHARPGSSPSSCSCLGEIATVANTDQDQDLLASARYCAGHFLNA